MDFATLEKQVGSVLAAILWLNVPSALTGGVHLELPIEMDLDGWLQVYEHAPSGSVAEITARAWVINQPESDDDFQRWSRDLARIARQGRAKCQGLLHEKLQSCLNKSIQRSGKEAAGTAG